MFTGIIEDIGVVRAATRSATGMQLVVETVLDLSDTKLGDSIAIDGVCLTVTHLVRGWRATFDVGPESLAVTTLGGLVVGQRVHVERALRLSDRLGGHLVQGHVDGVGVVSRRASSGDALFLRFDAPPAVLRYCIHKGGLAIQGVSLTLNAVDESSVEVCLIPHTLERTALGALAVGARVNLEADLVGKYVERLLQQGVRPGASSSAPGSATEGVTWDLLSRSGFVDEKR
jgi:riboflavin synthase